MRRPESTQSFTLPSKVNLTVPGRPADGLPPLVSGNKPAPYSRPPSSMGNAPPRAGAVESKPKPEAESEEPEAGMVVLDTIRSVVPINSLHGARPRRMP